MDFKFGLLLVLVGMTLAENENFKGSKKLTIFLFFTFLRLIYKYARFGIKLAGLGNMQ